MIIDGLPTLSAPQGTDEIPVERGTTTYKTPLNSLPYAFQVDITSGEHDLNDYTTAGLYYFKSDTTLTNSPFASADGWLTVYVSSNGTYIKQVFQREGTLSSTYKGFYLRLCGNGTWSAWSKVTPDLPLAISDGGTGAATATAALANLKGFDLDLGTAIPSSADLNNYTTIGIYYCSSSTVAASLLNAPSTSAGFKLIVMYQGSTTQIRQIAIYQATDLIYERFRNSSDTWGAWQRLIHTGDLPLSISNIGCVTEDVTMPQLSLPASGGAHDSADVSKSGYTPVGIVGITGSGTSGCNIMEFYLSGTTAYIWANNNTSTAKSPTYKLTILYFKS